MNLLDLQSATFAARARTGNSGVGTRVKQGRFQVVSVEYDNKGKSTVVSLAEYQSLSQTINSLNALA